MSITFGVDGIRLCGVDIDKLKMKNLKQHEACSRYDDEDELKWTSLQSNLEGDAAKIMEEIELFNFKTKVKGLLLKYKNNKIR